MSCRSQTGLGRHCSRSTHQSPGFDIVLPFSTRHQRFTCVRLHGSYLTRSSPRLFTRCSPPRLFTVAARADLQPDPDIRLRETSSHLRQSFSLHTACPFLRGPVSSVVTRAFSPCWGLWILQSARFANGKASRTVRRTVSQVSNLKFERSSGLPVTRSSGPCERLLASRDRLIFRRTPHGP
jgi:hypothetical protein